MKKNEVPIAIKAFKYNGELIEPGDVFKPIGGKYDDVLLDPEMRYVRYVKKKEEEYKCDYCDRTFDTPQGKAAHMRFCDKKE